MNDVEHLQEVFDKDWITTAKGESAWLVRFDSVTQPTLVFIFEHGRLISIADKTHPLVADIEDEASAPTVIDLPDLEVVNEVGKKHRSS